MKFGLMQVPDSQEGKYEGRRSGQNLRKVRVGHIGVAVMRLTDFSALRRSSDMAKPKAVCEPHAVFVSAVLPLEPALFRRLNDVAAGVANIVMERF
jgi:hypothetical protein